MFLADALSLVKTVRMLIICALIFERSKTKRKSLNRFDG
ncbi:hypothetical protein GMES_3732 [Paraglaciecola mesophila KMM 241]|uniref:Uncharacterized protein n=1 Tax=Paraglaciecola mesophila KMM 241 TaxID=1128912 RepID=K6XZH6_9ALTE|nr:hypothetical protein GMES_3732 [Paraglaciecola mesophila KMM 241]